MPDGTGDWEIRVADRQDVAAIATVVNRAYRPAQGEAGWTHEAHLVAGARTSDAQVEQMRVAPGSVLLVGLQAGQIVACIHVEVTAESSYFGMLAVDPLAQGRGVGTRMLEFAERYAMERQGAPRLVMTVVSRRQDLVSFYLRRGYQPTGRVMDYPTYAGIPREPGLELVELEKRFTGIVAADVAPRARPSIYPEPFASRMSGRVKRALGDCFGLTNFGVNLTRLAPGAVSALRHAHATQDEFIYVLEGHPGLVTDAGDQLLAPGMCAGFKAGTGNGHHLVNSGPADVVYLEIGDRSAGDMAVYPDDDLQAVLVEGQWRFLHKNGTPY